VWLAKVVERGMCRPSLVQPKPIRRLRDLTRYRRSLVRDQTREKLRLEKLLDDAQIKLDSVISDLHGVSGRKMLNAMIAGERGPRVLADLAHGRTRVKLWQSLQRVRGHGVVFGPPKSRRSRRVLTMPTVVVEALRRHLEVQRADRAAAGGGWTESGLVFTTGGGRHLEPRNLNTAFARLIVAAGVRPIRLHDMCHTCATLLLSRGVSPRMVMDILGHSQIAVTMNTYGHVIPAMQQEAAEHMDAAFGDLGQCPKVDDEP
jgi:integrase